MIKEEIENNEVQNSEEVNNSSTKHKKKMLKTKKGKIIAILLLAYIIISIISYFFLVTGDWENQDGYGFGITLSGHNAVYDIGAGSPVGVSDLYDRYLYLGGNCIITFRSDGIIGIKPIWILSVTTKKLTIINDGEKYSFINLKVVKNAF